MKIIVLCDTRKLNESSFRVDAVPRVGEKLDLAYVPYQVVTQVVHVLEKGEVEVYCKDERDVE
jgi:hypothetical protein